MKYLNVNLAKHVQILYAENHKANERNFLNSKKKKWEVHWAYGLEWGKIFTNSTSDKGLVYRLC